MFFRYFILITITTFSLFSQKTELAGFSSGKCLSFIVIAGETNINNFEFTMDFGDRGLVINSENKKFGSSGKERDYYEISVPVKNFESNNKLIYKDFLELLKADEYPFVVIGIPYNQLNRILSGETNEIPEIKITIAGVTNYYKVPGLTDVCTPESRYINGEKTIRLTDFNLNPPEKFQGLIKVKDNVIINFGFVFLFENNI